MAYFCLVESATGVLRGQGWTLGLSTSPGGMEIIELANAPDHDVVRWDPPTKTFVAKPTRTRHDRLPALLAQCPTLQGLLDALQSARKVQLRQGCRELVALLGLDPDEDD